MRRQGTGSDKSSGLSGPRAPEVAARYPLSAGDSGEFPIRIARDGVWFYRDSPIHRKEIAKLFSTVLQRDGKGRYWLKTPVEQGMIEVEDAPFVAVEMMAEGEGREASLKFRNNFDDWVTADADHPIKVEKNPETGEPRPYIRVRDGLDALIQRSVFYQLVSLALPGESDGRRVLGVWSDGTFFELDEE